MVKNFPVIDGIYQNKMLDDLYSSKYGVEILIVNFILLLTAACPRSLQNQWKRTSLNRCVQTVTMETSTHINSSMQLMEITSPLCCGLAPCCYK